MIQVWNKSSQEPAAGDVLVTNQTWFYYKGTLCLPFSWALHLLGPLKTDHAEMPLQYFNCVGLPQYFKFLISIDIHIDF